MIEIRKLRSTDSLPEMTHLLHRAYSRLGNMNLNYTAVDQTVEMTRSRVSAGQCLVASCDGVIVGTIVVQGPKEDAPCEYFRRRNVAIANQFGVEPKFQSRGIGRSLMSAAEQWASEHSFDHIAVDTAEPATHLLELYERWGYRRVDFVQWPGKTYRSVVLGKPVVIGEENPDRVSIPLARAPN